MTPSLMKCPRCGETVLSSGLRCPYCGESLNEPGANQSRRWSSRSKNRNSAESDTQSDERSIPRAYILVLSGIILISLITAFSLLLFFSRPHFKPPQKLSISENEFPQFPAQVERAGPAGLARGENEAGENTAGVAPANDANAQSDRSDQELIRDKKIREVSNQVLSDLRAEEVITPDVVYLKSGGKIECSIVGETQTVLKLHRRNATVAIEKERVKKIEHKAPEEVERELCEMALQQATEIVDKGLIKDGGRWVPKETTAQHKVDSVLALLTEHRPEGTDVLGGQSHLSPDGEAQENDSSSPATSHTFDASGKKVNVSQLCDLLGLPIKVSGQCEIEGTMSLDEKDPKALNGRASIKGERLEVAPADFDVLILPANSDALLDARLTAKDGKIALESFTLNGKAYDLSGRGSIALSNTPGQETIDCSFSLVLKEPPTVTDRRLVNLGAGKFVDELVRSRTRIPLKLAGSLENSELELAPGSPLAKLVGQLRR